MKKRTFLGMLFVYLSITAFSQAVPTGNPDDFKVKPCLHSISYCGLWGQDFLTVDEFIVKAKKLGYNAVILVAKKPHLSPLDYDKAARAKLKKKIEDLGLTLVALAGYTDFAGGIDKGGAQIPIPEIHAAYINMVAELANDLGCKMVRIFTGHERPGIDYDKQYATVVEGITLAAKAAQKYGITLFVQNHHEIARNSDDLYRMLKEINLPNLKAGWDPWPAIKDLDSPEKIKQDILKMTPFIVNTISDGLIFENGKYKGDVEGFKTFYGTLKEIGYQGYLVYEQCSPLPEGGSIQTLDAAGRKFLNYVQQFK